MVQNSIYDINNNQRNLDFNLNNQNFKIKKDQKFSDAEKSDLTTNPQTNIMRSFNEISNNQNDKSKKIFYFNFFRFDLK